MTDHRDLLPVIVQREGATLPDGFDSWGIKSVRPDLKTYGGYQWPYPGQIATCDPARILRDNRDNCPHQPGDGLCVAHTWQGMASGGIPAITVLLVAYRAADVLGQVDGKLRTTDVAVVALVDGARLLREAGAGANLRGANLAGANLAYANLAYANLACANLVGANLAGANLAYANLAGANLRGADLAYANLAGANLVGANLAGANLAYANLAGANLVDANLVGANLVDANLTGANLVDANLTGADASQWTRWPTGYDPTAAGVVTR